MKILIIIINSLIFLYLSVGMVLVIFKWRKFDSILHRLHFTLFWLSTLLEVRRITKLITHYYEEGGASEHISEDLYISQVIEMLDGDTTEKRIRKACRTIDYIYTFKPTVNRVDRR